MSNFEQYQVNSVTKTPTSNPTQIRLGVSPKPNTPQHTPVSNITIYKGIPANGQNRAGLEEPKDIAASVYLNTTDFNTAKTRNFTFVSYTSTDFTASIEKIEGFQF